jgi:eukaryotic-like serine/threonine-protein kinase
VLRDVEHERRFAAEALTLAGLQHPNLVRLLDAGTDNDDVFLVLELLPGATLRDLLAHGPLGAARVARIGSETAAALEYFHRRGIVHRDVKPANLMLDEHGSVRLSDFGIARLLGGSAITTAQHAIGTMAYIAPDQLEGSDVGHDPGSPVGMSGSRAMRAAPATAGGPSNPRRPVRHSVSTRPSE